ncbi:MAG: hypothetical protein GY847_26550 [Proteobacteria bacterium]|nr:hypothetical protein [Pseudomonadota bacterium]
MSQIKPQLDEMSAVILAIHLDRGSSTTIDHAYPYIAQFFGDNVFMTGTDINVGLGFVPWGMVVDLETMTVLDLSSTIIYPGVWDVEQVLAAVRQANE